MSAPRVPETVLHAGAEALGFTLTPATGQRLLQFAELLQKWNRIYNLTAVRASEQILTHHLLDCLATVQPLQRETGGRALRLLDVGSGGGLPGVVLAICCPQIEVSCVDAVQKKAAFVQQVRGELALDNLHAVHGRVEELRETFDVVASRAFAALPDFVRWTEGALADGGIWMAMKGRRPDDELTALPPSVQVFHVEQLSVPGLKAERHLVWMRRATAAS